MQKSFRGAKMVVWASFITVPSLVGPWGSGFRAAGERKCSVFVFYFFKSITLLIGKVCVLIGKVRERH